MACNRETPSDRAASSAPPVRQSSDALVPCCNTNCHLFGCAATMNLCSQCYSEHILKEGSVFLSKPCDASGDGAVVRSNSDDAGGADNCRIGAEDDSAQRIEGVPESGGCAVAPPQVDETGLRELLMSKSKSMNRSVGVSDLHAIFRSVEASSVADMSGTASDLLHQRIPSPLSLSSASPRAFSPARRQVETKLPLPPLPPQQAVNRCLACRKRVGLLGFKCRCGDTFCALHRYSDKHDCSFDYKAAGRASIAKENPVVKASKIVKI